MALIPPLDLFERKFDTSSPELVGASGIFTVGHFSCPGPDIALTFDVFNGQLRGLRLGADPRSTAWIRTEWRRMTQARAGVLNAAGAVGDSGEISGDFELVLMVSGLFETLPWRSWRLLSPPQLRALSLYIQLYDSGLFGNVTEIA